ncbi:EDIL3 [Branchiostoma lanceolatum]|uniref:EDIL3 protein n=1 Tax=Branchiostoma lanceolatum TaxID=7740 RepID=A0A8K0A3I8_BRALA|nr:EDIL3 [Branchiostoma lanceolatum]
MRPPFAIILQLLLAVGPLMAVGASDCSSPLGMKSGAIRDGQISASSYLIRPRNARLDRRNGEWRANVNNQNQWLQVDLLNRTTVTGVQTQGRRTDAPRFVTTFTASYSDDGRNWTAFTEDGNETKVFMGNNNAVNTRGNTFNPPITARYIRIRPRSWNTCGKPRCITMRIELLGCDLQEAVDYCQPDPCVNGTCISGADNYACACYEGYEGEHCQVPIATTEPTERSNTATASSKIAGSTPDKAAITGGAVAAGVVLLIIAVVVFIVYLKRRQLNDSDKGRSAAQFILTETPSKDTQGALLSDDGEYMEPSAMTLQQPDTGSGVYENVPEDSLAILQQSGNNDVIYENMPHAPSSGHYQELRPSVYQSLQKC